MTALSVNLNKVAWLRNAREGARPSVVDAARTVIAAGAQGVTAHPRPDQRHIRPDDIAELADVLRGHPEIEFNIEGNPYAGPRDNGYPGFDSLIESARPHQATLVPDADGQLTSDHGWDLSDREDADRLAAVVARYRGWGARVSLFVDPVREQIGGAAGCGADRIELYTGPYAEIVERCGPEGRDAEESRRVYREAARYAGELGLGVNAGHDLNLDNLARFVAMGGIAEVSIGHALTADALEWGLSAAVGRYLDAIAQGISKQGISKENRE